MRPTYTQLIEKIKRLRQDAKNASTKAEVNYFEMEIMIAEEYLAKTISKGRH